MLNEDEGHAVVGGKRTDELPAGIEAAGGRTYADNREIQRARRRPARCDRTRACRRSGCFGLRWSIGWHGALIVLERLAPRQVA